MRAHRRRRTIAASADDTAHARARPLRSASRRRACASAAACRQDMHDQPKYKPLAASATSSATSGRRGPAWRARWRAGSCARTTRLHTGKVNGAASWTACPCRSPRTLVRRGRERYGSSARPATAARAAATGWSCSAATASRRSFHVDRLREKPVGYFFDVITNGFGAMPDYAAQIPVADRWAIVAYVRALQLSQNARLADVPAERGELARPRRARRPVTHRAASPCRRRPPFARAPGAPGPARGRGWASSRCGLGLLANPDQFFRSWLFAFLFWTGIVVGCLSILADPAPHGRACGGSSSAACWRRDRARCPLLALLFLPLAFGPRGVYRLGAARGQRTIPILQHKALYLNVPFFLGARRLLLRGLGPASRTS